MSLESLRSRASNLLEAGVPWHRQRLVRIALGVLAGYAILGFVALPAALRHYIPGALHDALGVQAGVDAVRFNPFSLRLELKGLRVSEATGEPLLILPGAVANAEVSSLFRWALTFDEISLQQPELDLVLEQDGRLNLMRVAAALPAGPPPDVEEAPLRLLIHRVDLVGARVRFRDASTGAPARTEAGPSDLHITRLSTLPEDRGAGTLEILLAGGARIAWDGELGLHPLASSGTVSIEGLKPEVFHDFLRPRAALDPVGGVIAASLGYELAMRGGQFSLQTRDMRLDVRDLLLRKAGAAKPLLALGSFTAEQGSFELSGHRLALGRVAVSGGSVSAGIDAAGVLDWDSLLPQDAAAPTAGPSASPPAQWSADVAAVALDGIGFDVLDQTRNAPLGLAVRLQHAGFALRAGPGANGPAIALSDATLELGDIVLSTGAERKALGSIARLALSGAHADVAAEQLGARRLEIDGLQMALHRESDGNLREIRLASAPDPVTPLPVSHAASEWKLQLGEFQITGLDASLADENFTPAVEYAIKGGSLGVKDIDTAGSAPLQLEAKLPVGQGGTISFAGSVMPDGDSADVTLDISALSLVPLAPLVAKDTTLALDGGSFSSALKVSYRAAGEAPLALTVSGGASVDALGLHEAQSGARFLGWKSLEAAGIDFSLGPDHLGITELRLNGADAKVVVQQDRSVNLASVMREPASATGSAETAVAAAPAQQPPPAASAAPVSDAAAAPEAFPVIIDRVRVQDSVVDFADFSLVLPFAARIEALTGVAKGVSSDANGRATLRFSGRVGEYGEADIDGQLAPFDPTRFTDIEIAFRNIALTPLSPYSATFAGRTIKAGDLDLALQYKVDNQKLLGKNELVLQNFKLGESVKSKDAISLPLDLAIALLSDSKGRIDLAVPVSGNVGDPKFSYGHLIWKAIGNLITGVVTAPFRALGSLFGAGEEQVQAIRFNSGSAELTPMERQRIAKVATALSQRPKLGVRVPAATHPERDGYALRRLALRRLHATEMGYELQDGEDPGPVSYSNGRSQRALEKLLAARGGDDAPDRFATTWAKKQGREPERVNAALAMLGRGSPDHEFYRAMYLDLVKSTPEPAGGLDALAKARAEAISAEFRARGVDPARVAVGKPVAMQKAQPSGVMLPLELVASG